MLKLSRWLVTASVSGLTLLGCTSAHDAAGHASGDQGAATNHGDPTQALQAGATAGDGTQPGSGDAQASAAPVGQVRDAAAVNTLATAAAPSGTEVAALITKDAASAGGDTFYVSFAHLARAQGAGTEDLEVYRFGVTKALNSLSTRPKIALLTPLDAAQTVYRSKLADFALSQIDWSTITSAPGAAAAISKVGNATVVRGDWLVYALTRPEVYDTIMHIPNFVSGGNFGLPELESQLGADRSKSVYVTVNNSEVTFDTRILERIPVNVAGQTGGYYWRSYDFLSSADPVSKANGLADPSILHTAVASSGNLVAGEMFFSLPNGLQGFMLSGFQRQHRIDAQSIVATDHNRPQDGLTHCVGPFQSCGYVINGESCLVCHSAGIKMSSSIQNVKGATKEEAVALMTQDMTRYTNAVKSMGFASIGIEPIKATLARYRNDNKVVDTRPQGSEVNAVINISTIFGR